MYSDISGASRGARHGVLVAFAAFSFIVAPLTIGEITAGTRCEDVTYELQGSPPAYVALELAVAIEEIERRTGLSFVARPIGEAELLVSWTEDVGSVPTASPDQMRVVGMGWGQWLVGRDRSDFVAGVIRVDAARSWPLGLERGDSLAAVFVHEIGHALGLSHNAEPGTFMYPVAAESPPRWTPTELGLLAEVGTRAGCSR